MKFDEIMRLISKPAHVQSLTSHYKSVTELAADNQNLYDYLRQLERERDDMVSFIREQVQLWDNDGDSGFPLYEHGKRILERYPLPPK